MADLGEIFDGSVYIEIGGDRASALGDPIREPLNASAILRNMARFAGAPASPHAHLLDRRASSKDLGELFDGSKIDMGPPSALEELSTHRQWVAWRYLLRPGATKPTKPPVNPHNGLGASHAKPSDWGTYEQAEAMAARRKFAGVGFVLSEDDDYTGIDLDKCRDPATGKLDLWAEDIVSLGETYWEVSPSGTGLRAIVRGKIAKTVKCDTAHVEVYRSLRYLTITGDHIEGTPEDIRPAPTTLEWLMARVAQFAPKEIEPHFEPPKVLNAALVTPARQHNDTGERAWAEAALERNAADLAACGEGGRNHDLNAKAYRMGRMVARGWIEKSRVEAALTDACHANGYIKDKGIKATRDTLASGLRSGAAKPCADLADSRADDEQRLRALGDETAKLLIEANDNSPRETILVDGVTIDAETGEIIHAVKAATGQRKTLKATPYSWPDCASIRPREWLYGKHLIRRFVSATVAPGGVGKSSLLIAEALSMVSGRALLHGIEPIASLNVWIWNGEDPIEELNRRIAATAKHYNIKREECLGRLFVDSGRDLKLVIAETVKGGTVIARPVIEAIKATVLENKIDVLVIDPFVSSHRVSENDNSAIDLIAREWANIADVTGCAVELVYHVRKVGEVEVTVEDARGASALISAVRSARVLNRMTKDESEKAGVENGRLYFRVDNGKSSMSPSHEKATWYHMRSVDLENAGQFQQGDCVGVVTEWKKPNPLEGVSVSDLRAVQEAVADGRWRENSQAKDWVGRAVAQAMGLDASNKQHRSKIVGLLKVWKASGALVEVDGDDAKGMARRFVEVGTLAND